MAKVNKKPPSMYEPKKVAHTYPKFARTTRPKNFEPVYPSVQGVYVREQPKIRSLVTPGGIAYQKQDQRYTGDKAIGISLMHKSCFQPVFSTEEAIEHAKMRRN